MEEKLFDYSRLLSFAHAVFKAMGCSDTDSRQAAEALLSADLRGVDSHGVARLIGYVRLWEVARVNPVPQIRIIHETPSTAVVDGDAGLGLVVAPASMKIAIAKAREAGTGWVSVQNSNHFGIAGYHAMIPLAEDMIGIALTNASPLVSPTFSTERLLGTNPVAVAIPAGEQAPFVADMATTTAANGKLEILQRKNMDAPDGWIQDEFGMPTNNAHALKKGGALLPLGGDKEHGSHKGYAMGSIVDIFSAILSGANYGPWVPPFPAYVPMPSQMPGKGIGHFFGAMRIDAFRPAEDFKRHMDQWLKRFRNARPAANQQKVVVPGDPEREISAKRLKDGIPVHQEVLRDLSRLAEQFHLYL